LNPSYGVRPVAVIGWTGSFAMRVAWAAVKEEYHKEGER